MACKKKWGVDFSKRSGKKMKRVVKFFDSKSAASKFRSSPKLRGKKTSLKQFTVC